MNYQGYIIYRERLRRNWSQAGLCKGICTVSYLSKIESGKAEPSEEIVRLLLDRLDLEIDQEIEREAAKLADQGWELLFFDFSYVGYLAVSLLLACLGAVDELAFTSIYPELIPEGAEQKGYAVSSMLYPVLTVIMTPLAAVLLDTLGVAWILIAQSGLSLAAAITESFIHLDETERQHRTPYSLQA